MVRRWFGRLDVNPRSRDAVVAALWLLLGLALLQLDGFDLWSAVAVFQSSGGAFLFLLLAMVAVSTQRSSRPFLALGTGAILAAVDLLYGGSLGVILVFTDLIYAAFKYGNDRGVRVVVWLIAGLGVSTLITLVIWHSKNWTLQIVAAQWAAIVLIAAMWGWNVRSERLRTKAAMADQHAKSTQQLRRRIAHDLHDLVANQIAVASLHIEAAKLQIEQSRALPQSADRSLEQAAHGTKQADQQLRRMIQVLNTVEDLSAQSEVDVQQLVDDFVQSLDSHLPGDRVLEWAGAGAQGLYAGLSFEPAAQARVVLRALQELIANAVKHGRGDVQVKVDVAEDFSITVTNDVSTSTFASSGSGIGLNGAEVLLEGTGTRLESQPREGSRQWLAVLALPAKRV